MSDYLPATVREPHCVRATPLASSTPPAPSPAMPRSQAGEPWTGATSARGEQAATVLDGDTVK